MENLISWCENGTYEINRIQIPPKLHIRFLEDGMYFFPILYFVSAIALSLISILVLRILLLRFMKKGIASNYLCVRNYLLIFAFFLISTFTFRFNIHFDTELREPVFGRISCEEMDVCYGLGYCRAPPLKYLPG